MEKRVLAAIALSIGVLFLFRYYEERQALQMAGQKPAASRPAPATPSPAAPAPAAAEAPASAAPAPAPSVPLPAEETVSEQKIVVEGSLYRAVLDNRGAVLVSWQLNKYKSAKGDIFDMVSAAHVEQRTYPAALEFDDPALTALANQQNYVVVSDGLPEGDGTLKAPATVVMRLRRGEVLIEKRFRFDDGNYLLEVSTLAQRGGQPLPGRMLVGQDIGPEHEHLLNPSVVLSAVYDLNGKVQREAAPKAENETKTISGNILWTGLEIQYFAAIAIPSRPLGEFRMQHRVVEAAGLAGEQLKRSLIPMTVVADNSVSYRLYLGPKSQAQLEAIRGADLSDVVNYGMFSIIVRPLLVALQFINQYARNYGVAIILLTFILTLALFPFRLKQMVSMKKMQALQPRIKEIQERYKRYKKADPKRAEMNQEIMAVYKENHVNPLGGCLPLLLQMPLLFAFYSLLAYSIDLRQAPFFWWIHDLSVKDPLYILPIVMGITMLISQKMTPMSPGADPTQAKMMMIMPVVFTIFFLNVSSGLNLYFLCSNVFQIAFQKIAERWMGDQQSVSRSKA